MLAGTIALIGEHLKKGARIRIAGLGTLEVRKRAARMGRNPATGERSRSRRARRWRFAQRRTSARRCRRRTSVMKITDTFVAALLSKQENREVILAPVEG